MSFLTEYFDEFRPHPIRKQKPCLPEDKWAKLEGLWLDTKKGKDAKELTDEEIKAFIQKTMKGLRGQSAYFNGYCAHLDQDFKTRPPVARPKKRRPCHPEKVEVKEDEASVKTTAAPLALKDTEVMKMAHQMYNRDMNAPSLKPLDTNFRVMGYVRPQLYKTGLSEYQGNIARLAYELVRDDRIPKYVKSNGNRPWWGYPPEGVRQPMLDGAPYDGERLY